MAEGNGEIAVRDPDELVKEIERTRENLTRTIDELTTRVSPGHLARDAAERAKRRLTRPEVRLAGGLAVAAVAALAYAAWRRRK